jgi:hypothetical protein
MAEPKEDRKGAEPKEDRKGAEPKEDRKGAPGGGGADSLGCGNGNTAVHILQSAADLCGFLVVAVVAPIGGGRGHVCESGDTPRQVALAELRRKAEFKRREAQNRLSGPPVVQAAGVAPPQGDKWRTIATAASTEGSGSGRSEGNTGSSDKR